MFAYFTKATKKRPATVMVIKPEGGVFTIRGVQDLRDARALCAAYGWILRNA